MQREQYRMMANVVARGGGGGGGNRQANRGGYHGNRSGGGGRTPTVTMVVGVVLATITTHIKIINARSMGS
jgi:hypothetical protein